jgi:hypothetical protein
MALVPFYEGLSWYMPAEKPPLRPEMQTPEAAETRTIIQRHLVVFENTKAPSAWWV